MKAADMTLPPRKTASFPMVVIPLVDGRYRVTSERDLDTYYEVDAVLQTCSCPDWDAYGGPEKDGRGRYPLNHPERLCKHGKAVRHYQQCVRDLGQRQPTPAQVVQAAAPIAAPAADPSKSACRNCKSTRWRVNESGVCAACFVTGDY